MPRPCLRFGLYFLDPEKGVLSLRGEPVAIGRRGVAILEALLSHVGEVVSKEALLDAAWPGIAVEESNLSVQIATLRKALVSLSDNNEGRIGTVQRLGYRFSGVVERMQRNEPTDGDRQFAAGARLLFLPKYSPDLNPIEQVFAKIKGFVRKAAPRTLDAISHAIAQALAAIKPAECKNYLAGAGYASA